MPLYPFKVSGPDGEGATISLDSVIGAATVEDAEHFARLEFAKAGGIEVLNFDITEPVYTA